jgi:hypothetical protein
MPARADRGRRLLDAAAQIDGPVTVKQPHAMIITMMIMAMTCSYKLS